MSYLQSGDPPLFTPIEQRVQDLVSKVPSGYVTSTMAIAVVIYGAGNQCNSGGNVAKVLKNLAGRATLPAHRVLKKVERSKNSSHCGFGVREDAQIAELQSEGVSIDSKGRLTAQDAFWDFSPDCEKRHLEKAVRAAGGDETTGSGPSGVGRSMAEAIVIEDDGEEVEVVDLTQDYDEEPGYFAEAFAQIQGDY